MTHIDKSSLKHFTVCFLLAIVGAYGMAFALGANVTKEWYDRKDYGHWCWLDLLFDILGCAVGIGIHLWIFHSWNF